MSKQVDWTEAEVELLYELRETHGLSFPEIQKRHFPGRTIPACRGRYNRILATLSEEEKKKREAAEGLYVREEGPNHVTVMKRGSIKSPLELIAEAGLDSEDWIVTKVVLNGWEVGAKAKWVDLTYDDGRATGTVKEDGLKIAPLYQVKVHLTRKQPIAVCPIIHPIECPEVFSFPEGKAPADTAQASLVLADLHVGFYRDLHMGELIPFHDQRAMSIAVQVARDRQPDRIDILGDVLDLPEWTDKFLRSPEMLETTQPAINAVHAWLKSIRQVCPDAEMYLYRGNHEKRPERAIITHLRAAYGLRAADELDLPPALSVPRLLALHQLGVIWVEENEWLNDDLVVGHGQVARKPGLTSKAISESDIVHQIHAHIHRREVASRTLHTRHGQKTVTATCFGCLCHIDGRVPARTTKLQWQQGIGIVQFQEQHPVYSTQHIHIEDGQALWQGNVYCG